MVTCHIKKISHISFQFLCYLIIICYAKSGLEDTMPTYDFNCKKCGKRFEITVSYSEYDPAEVKCSYCGSGEVSRKIGRIRVARSDDSRVESFADPSVMGNLGQDPVSLGRMMRQMSNETGEAMPPEFDEVVGRLEKGETPEQIEKQMPDLGDDSGFSGSGMD